jgi:hypothetical protein
MTALANAVLIAHLAIVLFIVGGLLATWLGAARGWHWVRNRCFRALHLGAIVFVAAEALLGIVCPLTMIEDALRGSTRADGGFIERWVGRLLYYDFPSWVFTASYAGFALLTALTWRWVPPRKFRCGQ